MPVFSWTMVVTCLMVLFAFPALLVALGLLWAQRHMGGVLVGNTGAVAYQQLFWFYGHPVVYVMFFPFMGMAAEVVATFSQRRFFGYPAFVVALLAFSGLSMTVWGHHMFTFGQVTNKYFALTSTALIVPAGIEYFDFLGTIWRGALRFTTPFLFALAFLVQFLVGGLTGVILASPPLDYGLNMSYFVVAHFHYTIFAGSAFALFAGVYFWFPKITGVMLREGLGKLHFTLMLVGANLTFFPMFILGAEGMTRRIAVYPRASGWQPLNELETAGAFVIALATQYSSSTSPCRSVFGSRPAMTRGVDTRSSGRRVRRRRDSTSRRCHRSAHTHRSWTCAKQARPRPLPRSSEHEARRDRLRRVGRLARSLDSGAAAVPPRRPSRANDPVGDARGRRRRGAPDGRRDLASGARRSPRGETQLITSESIATATVAVGLAILLLGASFGLFLLLIGSGVTLFGLGGIVREGRARGRLSRDRRTR